MTDPYAHPYARPDDRQELVEPTCNHCGIPLTGAAALIGVCVDCVQASTLAESTPRNRQPSYGFARRRNGRGQEKEPQG